MYIKIYIRGSVYIFTDIVGCLVLNTGISLVCVRYNQTVAHQGPDIHNVVSAKFNTFNTQLFVIPVSPVHEVRMPGNIYLSSCSAYLKLLYSNPVCNSSILMKVYYQNQPMVLLKKSNKVLSYISKYCSNLCKFP